MPICKHTVVGTVYKTTLYKLRIFELFILWSVSGIGSEGDLAVVLRLVSNLVAND